MLEKVQELITSGKLRKENRIIFFGANKSSIEMNRFLRTQGFIPDCFIDNSEKKQGTMLEDMQVCSPAQALQQFDDTAAVLIASEYYKEMTAQLKEFGYVEETHIFVVHRMQAANDDTKESLQRFEPQVKEGMELYLGILEEFKSGFTGEPAADGKPMIVHCPYPGTGDIYLIGLFLKHYLEKHRIENYVVTVVGNVSKKILALFGDFPVKVLSQKDSDKLLSFLRLMGEETPFKVLNDSYHRRMYRRLRGFKELDFLKMFAYGVFGFETEEAVPLTPPKESGWFPSQEEVISFMKEHNVVKGKTAILSPYANTIIDLPQTIWEELAQMLKQKGYTVFTNSAGPNEPAVKGTKELFIPFSLVKPVMKEAGLFIGLRSGLCDIIADCGCKKIIFYPAGCIFGNCSTLQYFGLNRMGLCDDAVELEYVAGKEYEVLEKAGKEV